jgi:hypothetical protein
MKLISTLQGGKVQMPEFTFSQFVYLDTNIIGYLAENKSVRAELFDFLCKNNLCLGFSVQFTELSDVRKLHKSLAELLLVLPSASIKSFDEVVDEEIIAHPKARSGSLLSGTFNQLLFDENGHKIIEDFLASLRLRKVRKSQRRSAKQFGGITLQLKHNFKPFGSGDYIPEQANEFSSLWIIQFLALNRRSFMVDFKDRIEKFHPESFLSLKLIALVIFYKYYIDNKAPRLSDFADLFHLYALPYCKIAVMERDLCNILNRIKVHEGILGTTLVRNIDFLHSFK